ncbi:MULTISPECIES: potassium channel family protein [Dethiosulfovibrio]|uniref:Potassium channel protein n=2 Tax=Dethiosulfovibrio TaxID=47054 RepID=A0ABS9ENG8_9BACT|nr:MULTISPECIES: potassium channel protein [Dethiosulfovibrio]MCF4114081.1 potassium channel protein [Dethiosulfovibrio russensis]MCF4142729.1 potassium channel protein [Dethiosulfovibrio marinus]MCF4144707.1 potassium channel protein [Dethiosulfovibrio acidaminovorans]
MKIQRQSRYLLGWISGVTLTGILGMRFFLDLSWVDSIFYTATTVSTVGYGAPPGVDDSDKLFLAILIAASLGTVGYAIGIVSQNFFTMHIRASLGKGHDRRIKRMDNHWIICGLGRYGRQVAAMLRHEGVPFSVIESKEEVVVEARDQGYLMVQGDASEEDALLNAGVERAKGLIVTLDSDAQTVYVALTARALNRDIHIVARASDTKSVSVLTKAGVNRVVNPVIAGSASLVRASLKPSVADLLDLVVMSRKLDLDFSTVTVEKGSSLAGKTLMELDFRNTYDVTVLAILGADDAPVYNPTGGQTIKGGDRIMVFGERHRIASLREALGKLAT